MKTAHLNALRAVEAVAREGSLRRAADALGVTPAAVGQQVRAFEAVAGRPLFARTSSGLRPLPVLRDALPRLTGAMSTLGEILADLSGRSDPDRISLSATQALAENWLPRVIPRVSDRVGHARLIIDATQRVVDLTSGEFDFAIRHCATVPGDLASIPLLTDLQLPLATPDFAARYELAPGVTDLSRVPLCHTDLPGSESTWLSWREWALDRGVTIDETRDDLRFTRHASAYRAAQSGLALVLGGLVESLADIDAGRMVMPLGPDAVVISDRVGYRLLWRKGRRLTKPQRRFRDLLAEEAARLQDDMARHLGRAIPRLA